MGILFDIQIEPRAAIETVRTLVPVRQTGTASTWARRDLAGFVGIGGDGFVRDKAVAGRHREPGPHAAAGARTADGLRIACGAGMRGSEVKTMWVCIVRRESPVTAA